MVKAVILREKKLLIVRESFGDYNLPGGTYESGEGDTDALLREVKEETAYSDVRVGRFLGQAEVFYVSPTHKLNTVRRVSAYAVDVQDKLDKNFKGEDGFESMWVDVEDGISMIQKGIFKNEADFVLRALGRIAPIYTGSGPLINSGSFDGMPSEEAKWKIAKHVGGERKVQFRLRDWLISRQRYWGPPIPMIHCDACAAKGKGEQKGMPGWYAVPERDLPVKLPFVKEFRPSGKDESPLASVKSFYRVKCPACKSIARRETDVSDTFLDSAWYYLRYPSVSEKKAPWNKAITKKWFPVDMYIGGAEHSVLHLLYVRFMTMVLKDLKYVHFEEPFPMFRAHGLLIKDGAKMSKSKGNVVNPDEYIRKFGADTLRMYLMFLAPFEQGGDFRDAGILGVERFLNRAWALANSVPQASGSTKNPEILKTLHKTVKKVTEDVASLNYNTAISSLMICLNALEADRESLRRDTLEIFTKLFAPFAPHLSEEIWRGVFGHKSSIHKEVWPKYDARRIKEDTVTVAVQINGKTRGTIVLAPEDGEEKAIQVVMKTERLAGFIGGNKPKRVIYIPGRLINIIV
ncbi:MAG: class I tRNA ligase family protein [Patescibacteria group bacterium]